MPYRSISLFLLAALLAHGAVADSSPKRFPDIVLITIDTLRADRLSAYGYSRPTSPEIDRLLARGVRFSNARVPEPLTAPSMVSMVTSLHPHEHGTSRNGLRMRPELPSLPNVLKRRGYVSAAFVSNWTLRDEISGLAEHFQEYQEVFTRMRWYVFAREADGNDVTDAALDWIEDHLDQPKRRPFLAWVHYVEPHAPYRLHEEFQERLGFEGRGSDSDRYDTEVAFVDRAVGRLVDRLDERISSQNLILVFASDHGESLGEHSYWGHGRHLYEPTLHIPLGVVWERKLLPSVESAPATLLDITPTILGLLDLEIPDGIFRGFDWTPVFAGQAKAPLDRATWHQAHRGAVKRTGNTSARRQGLLEVGRVQGGSKEIFRVTRDRRWIFDLEADPRELKSLTEKDSDPSEELQTWWDEVKKGLEAADDLPPPSLDAETLEQLKALGYID